jgi:hypothetical protein
LSNKQSFNEEENFQNEANFSDEEEISKEELAQALSFYIGGQVGISEEISPEEAGRLGAFLSDLLEVIERVLNNELAEEIVLYYIVEKLIAYIISPLIDISISKTIDISIFLLNSFGFTEETQLLKAYEPYIKVLVNEILLKITKKATKTIWTIAKIKIF